MACGSIAAHKFGSKLGSNAGWINCIERLWQNKSSMSAENAAASPALSIIMPVLNEAQTLGAVLGTLGPLRARGVEIIVADGGSSDGTAAAALEHADLVLVAERGRAVQMNTGATAARSNVLLFLHADTTLPDNAQSLIAQALASGADWGRFDVRIAGAHPLLPLVAWLMNLRSRVSGIATGDQAMFVRRALFETIGGFPALPLMEDIALSKRLRERAPPACLRAKVVTSGRRWDQNGFWRTVFLMWRLRWLYYWGSDPRALAELYGRGPRGN